MTCRCSFARNSRGLRPLLRAKPILVHLGQTTAMTLSRVLITKWNELNERLGSTDNSHHCFLEGFDDLTAILSPDQSNGPTCRHALEGIEAYTRDPHFA